MIKNAIVAAALLSVGFGANAALTGGVAANQSPASFIDLSVAGVVTGGALYTLNALPNAAIPSNVAPLKATVGTWLAAGPTNSNNGGGDATVSFGAGEAFVSFLWGSPDPFNMLTVTTNLGSYMFTSASPELVSIVANGDQDFASYLGFDATGGELITSLTFNSPEFNAFEASNFSTTSPIPEPETYALMLAGLGVVGFMARRRRAD
jgi:hypothetical protein